MDSAFGVDHGEVSKGVGDAAKTVGGKLRQVTGARSKSQQSWNQKDGRRIDRTQYEGSWALKPKQVRTVWGTKVKTETTGGGLTGKGKVAAGTAGTGAAVGGYQTNRKRRGY